RLRPFQGCLPPRQGTAATGGTRQGPIVSFLDRQPRRSVGMKRAVTVGKTFAPIALGSRPWLDVKSEPRTQRSGGSGRCAAYSAALRARLGTIQPRPRALALLVCALAPPRVPADANVNVPFKVTGGGGAAPDRSNAFFLLNLRQS